MHSVRSLLWVLLILPCACASSNGHNRDTPSLLVGRSAVEITPPVGYRMAGYFYERLATAVHDPLMAKTLVFKQADTRFSITVCDLCHMSPAVAAQARELASRQTGIPADHIAISATHTHTGPDYFGVLRDHLHSLALAARGADPAEVVDYPNILAEKIAAGIVEADKAAEPAELSAGSAEQPNVAFNRRYVMKDGSVAWNPGKRNPNIVKPAGPVDPEVLALSVTQYEKMMVSGEPLEMRHLVAVLTNFPLHPDTVGGTEFSADFPHYIEETLRRRLEWPELVSIFAQGTSGNINHIDVNSELPQKGQDEAERIGTALAERVTDALLLSPPERRPPFTPFTPEQSRHRDALERRRKGLVLRPSLAVATTRVDLPVQQFTPEEVANARSLFARIQERKLPFLVGVKATKIVKIYDRYHGQPISAQVQGFRLSDDTAIVTLPGELFVELGLAIKRQSPFKNTILIELANDSFGYIPTRRGFEEGNYEPTNSTVQAGSGERLVETAVSLLRRLKGL
jgi:neutral ceramidase